MSPRRLPKRLSRCAQWVGVLATFAALLALPGTARADAVQCGAVVTHNTKLDTDVSNCLGDGLVVAASGITIDLNGKILDGVGRGVGIRNDGYHGVTIKNGTVSEFQYGVQLNPGTAGNVLEGLTVSKNEINGVQLDGATQNQVRDIRIEFQANQGLVLLNGSNGNAVAGNTLFTNGDTGIFVQNSTSNLFQSNTVTISGDRGVVFEGASNNALFLNAITNNSDGGVNLLLGANANYLYGNTLSLNQDAGFIVSESNGNRIELNSVSQNGDAGLTVTRSLGSVILGNSFTGSSDSGIFLEFSNDSFIHGNDVRFNTGGLELTSSNGNRVQLNDASSSTGIGVELQDSIGNTILLNTANANGAQGIQVEGVTENFLQGNVIWCNTANENKGDGIVLAAAVHTLKSNIANSNDGWGIHSASGNVDGGGNSASDNKEATQCYGVFCSPAPRDCPAPQPPPPPPSAPPPLPSPSAAAPVLTQAPPGGPATPLPGPAANGTPNANGAYNVNGAHKAARCRIPNVKGHKLFKARARIARAGCRVGRIGWRHSRARKGRVIAQWPSVGHRVKRGFKVYLVRSKGVRASRD